MTTKYWTWTPPPPEDELRKPPGLHIEHAPKVTTARSLSDPAESGEHYGHKVLDVLMGSRAVTLHGIQRKPGTPAPGEDPGWWERWAATVAKVLEGGRKTLEHEPEILWIDHARNTAGSRRRPENQEWLARLVAPLGDALECELSMYGVEEDALVIWRWPTVLAADGRWPEEDDDRRHPWHIMPMQGRKDTRVSAAEFTAMVAGAQQLQPEHSYLWSNPRSTPITAWRQTYASLAAAHGLRVEFPETPELPAWIRRPDETFAEFLERLSNWPT